MVSREGIFYFDLLDQAAFAFPIELFLTQLMGFITFILQILFPIRLGAE